MLDVNDLRHIYIGAPVVPLGKNIEEARPRPKIREGESSELIGLGIALSVAFVDRLLAKDRRSRIGVAKSVWVPIVIAEA